jgi:hypothetical protein
MATTYSTTVQVKSIVWIDDWHNDTQFDSFIDELRDRAKDEINVKLRDYIDVDLDGTEEDYNIITHAEACIAGGYFRTARDEPTETGMRSKGEQLLKLGRGLIDTYIEEHFLKVKSDTSSRSKSVVEQSAKKFWEV